MVPKNACCTVTDLKSLSDPIVRQSESLKALGLGPGGWGVGKLYLRLFNDAHFKTYREREWVRLLKDAGHTVVNIDRYRISWLWGMMTARVTKDAA